MNRLQYQENVAMAFWTLRSHKLRSFLTVLGVIIGVMTVIVIASILTGMRGNIIDMVQDFGTDNLYAFHLSTGPQVGPRDRKEWTRKPLTLDDVDALRRQTTAIREVGYSAFGFNLDRTLRFEGEVYRRANLQGVSPNYDRVMNLALAEGRFFSEADDLRRAQVCILGVNVVEALFPNYSEVAGRVVELGGRRFTVIGVLEKRQKTFFGSTEEDNVVFIPYRTLRKISPRTDFLLVVLRAMSGRLNRAWDEAEAVLRRQRGVRFDEANNFSLNTSEKMVEEFDAITGTIGLVAIAISAVGLLVGGIGVMNIMLVSVTERTREIGVRKAVGARRRDITFQFLCEAMTLTTTGGLIGVLLAILASSVVSWLVPGLPAQIPLWAVIAGVAVSMSVGLIFGVWPAVKAARLDPIESLRYE